MVAPLTPDRARLAAIRDALPALSAGIYLNTAVAGPLPTETSRAMAEIAAGEGTIGRAHPRDAFETVERVAETRGVLAAVLGADLESVALTFGTAHGIAIALNAAELQASDRIVVGVAGAAPAAERVQHDGATRWLGWPGDARWPFGLLERLGGDVATVAVDEADDDAALVAAFDAALGPRTRLVVLPHVSPSTGSWLPIERIAASARAAGALVVADAGQSVGAVPVAPDDLGVDALAFPSERWLLGPVGLGGLWCGPRMLERSRSIYPGGFLDAASTPADDPVAAAPWPRAPVVGFARSCGWLSMHVGLPWCWGRAVALAQAAADRLAATPGVRVLTPRDRIATLVSLALDGWPAGDALDELGARVFAIAGLAPGLDAIRISPAAFNSEDEIDRFVDAVAFVAAHTPETIPARRTLNVLS